MRAGRRGTHEWTRILEGVCAVSVQEFLRFVRVRTIIVTDSAGLIGSETVKRFAKDGARLIGIDNDMRAEFFGAEASTRKVRDDLIANVRGYEHHDLDIRDASAVMELFKQHDLRGRQPALPRFRLQRQAGSRQHPQIDLVEAFAEFIRAPREVKSITSAAVGTATVRCWRRSRCVKKSAERN
jgi:NAD(P)-dependent dehydrogenase (short-subunit alcohol dehydrogenase family)